MAAKDGPRPPCAACKYQRRRCWPGCTLAPYFPAEKPKMFKNAHRLYGVCNMTRMLRRLRDDQKDDAMKSVIYESDLRQRFPVYGCLGIIRQLQEQLKRYQDELYHVNSLLAAIKLQGQSRNHQWRNQSPGRGVPKKLASQCKQECDADADVHTVDIVDDKH
ncbi:hypothetical protein Nepgr_021224 [Nepenthes gracilis]|uniref:LOB domain-containing protein n=1 Tax=Nepenthes gracilis TaxID=150966 RepID=A0AAD3SWG4_NEPGR|nr:hypothetical protein Nepgr_021224 [Nepenthes gracilis]